MTDHPDTVRPTSPREIFLTFQWLALQGFGGVIAIAQRALCEDKRWLTREQFIELLAVAQVLPGPNVCNLALMVGDRYFGWRGATAAMSGLLVVPLAIVLGLTAVYTQFATLPQVAGALKGMAAVSAGLIAGTSLKLATALKSSPPGPRASALVAAITFGAVAWLRLPLLWVIAVIGGASMAWSWRVLQRADRAGLAAQLAQREKPP